MAGGYECSRRCPSQFKGTTQTALRAHQTTCPGYREDRRTAELARSQAAAIKHQKGAAGRLARLRPAKRTWGSSNPTPSQASSSSSRLPPSQPILQDVDMGPPAGDGSDREDVFMNIETGGVPIDVDAPQSSPNATLPASLRIRIPPRSQHLPPAHDTLPEPIPVNIAGSDQGGHHRSLGVVRRVVLRVRDGLSTAVNSFGLWREYPRRPTFDPDHFVPPSDLAKTDLPFDDLIRNINTLPEQSQPLHENATWGLLHKWQASGSNLKSNAELDRLVREYLLHPDFDLFQLEGFRAQKVSQQIDKADAKASLLDHFQHTAVPIDIPSGSQHVPSRTFDIPGLYYRRLTDMIRSAFAHPLAAQYHLSPFKLFHTSPATEKTQRVHSELYDSDAFIKEHEDVQHAPKDPNDPDCQRERVVAAMMIWSDSTHLANFGTAKLWPIYMFLGNLSKYIRALPNSGACQHVAYIPSLPDSLQDELSKWHTKWARKTHRKDLLAHCRRELMHAVWKHLLDDDFVHAYTYGMVIKCLDGIERRIFPRLFTYSADYPEKVLLATIRDKGLCPCPRCLIPKEKLHLMGQVPDMRSRFTKVRHFLWDKVQVARRYIYRHGWGVKSEHVEGLLRTTSSVPTMNAFVERLGEDFQLSRMLAPDFMHEFELGVWKALFTHLIRLLYAIEPDGSRVQELDDRFRRIPTFGHSTIRNFHNNTSEMKKLAARDMEDILQCCIPVFDGLFKTGDTASDEKNNRLIMKLLYRAAEFHGLAKLRVHTEETLERLEVVTAEFGRLMRWFRDDLCPNYDTYELPSETARRDRQAASRRARAADATAQAVPEAAPTQAKKRKFLNISTPKFHSLGDYVPWIRLFGPSDGFSTQLGELAHRIIKRLYGLTNKRNAPGQIGARVRRLERARVARQIRLRQMKLRNVVHRVSAKPKAQDQDRSTKFNISNHQKEPVDLTTLIEENRENPAFKNFLPKFQDHILGRLLQRQFDGDNHEDFTDEERNSVHIYGDRLYQVGTCQINYTTYDNRRDYDVINPKTHPDVLVPSPEDDKDVRPFWHARVVAIYHAKVRTTHPDAPPSGYRHVEVLLVRWFGAEVSYNFGFRQARLPKIGFVPYEEDFDNFAFGFLDPSQVVRGVHLIPDFSNGLTHDLLPFECPIARQLYKSQLASVDYTNYYVDIFVDRDMLMRHLGGGIGHGEWRPAAMEPTPDVVLEDEVVVEDNDESDSEGSEGPLFVPGPADSSSDESSDSDSSDDEDADGNNLPRRRDFSSSSSEEEEEDTDDDDDGGFASD